MAASNYVSSPTDLYVLATSDCEDRCCYCTRKLANQWKLDGWEICKSCDQEIMNGKELAAILPENWYN